MADWYTIADEQRLVGAWPAAPIEQQELCGMLLNTARDQIIAYAPPLADGEALPDRYVLAQLYQVRNLWNAGRADGNGEIGSDDFNFTPRPLDKTIKNMLRPIQGDAHVL